MGSSLPPSHHFLAGAQHIHTLHLTIILQPREDNSSYNLPQIPLSAGLGFAQLSFEASLGGRNVSSNDSNVNEDEGDGDNRMDGSEYTCYNYSYLGSLRRLYYYPASVCSTSCGKY